MVFRAKKKKIHDSRKKLRTFPDSNLKVVAPMVCAQKRVKIKYRNLCSKMSINITFLDFTQYCLTVVMVLVTQKVPKK